MNNDLTILIPLAGEGKRFIDVGYEVPKPLIEVSGKPMIIKAVESLPKGNNYVFICRKNHIKEYHLDQILEKEFNNCQIISIDFLTEGQASTCLLAENMTNPNCQLLIGPCDNGLTWNQKEFENLVADINVDALIWTFRKNVTVKHNPTMYGWVSINHNQEALNVSCKIPISETPINDHAVVGTFWFRHAKDYFSSAKQMIKKNRRINNEFYVDVVMNELIQEGKNVRIFEIDKYIGWGTPNDLKTYEYWENFFNKKY